MMKKSKKFLIRLPKDAKPTNNEDEVKLIRWAFEDIYNIKMDDDDIIRADILKQKHYK